MAIKFPGTIKIGFATYRVIVSRILEEHGERTGSFHRGRREICVSNELTGDKAAYVLLHEVLHGVYSHWTLDEGALTEERVVASFSDGLLAVFRDNPDFGRWLLARLK